MLLLSPFLFPRDMSIMRLSSPPYSQGKWGTEQPGVPHSAWAETRISWSAKGCPECRGEITKSNLSDPNPFHPHKANTTTGQHRELESKMKCFLHHPAPSVASLFFVSSVPPNKGVHLQGLFWSVVYGWMLPLIVNGAIRPLLYIVSIGVWQRIWRMLYLHSRNIYTKDSFYSLLIYHHLRSHSAGAIVCGCVSFQLQRI